MISDGPWGPEFTRATVAALVEGVCPRDFQEEGARDVELKGLQAGLEGVFTLMKNSTEKLRIMEWGRSRHLGKKEKGDRRKTQNQNSEPLHYGAGLRAGAGKAPSS